jgi:Flp pilus assembly pilin Flp
MKRNIDPRLIPWIILMCGLFQILLATLISVSVVAGVTPLLGVGGYVVLGSLAWCWAVGTVCIVYYLGKRKGFSETAKLIRGEVK